MENQISQKIKPATSITTTDKCYQQLKYSTISCLFPFGFGILLLTNPSWIFSLVAIWPIFGILLLATIVYSLNGIVEGKKILKIKTKSSKTKQYIFGNVLILCLSFILVIQISSIAFAFSKVY